MKAANGKGKAIQEQTNHWQQIGFTDVLYRSHEFPLRDDIDGIDMLN